jgi:hypothetical protein
MMLELYRFFFWIEASAPQSRGLTLTQTCTVEANFPGAGGVTSIRSAVTSSPVARLKLAHGLGMRPKLIFWIGCPVAVFMIVAVIPMARR